MFFSLFLFFIWVPLACFLDDLNGYDNFFESKFKKFIFRLLTLPCVWSRYIQSKITQNPNISTAFTTKVRQFLYWIHN